MEINMVVGGFHLTILIWFIIQKKYKNFHNA